MIRVVIGFSAALSLAACSGPGGPRGPRNLRPIANPSAVIAAELAFAREAQDKGQWTAFADYAADDAVMFVPHPVRAKDWLNGRDDPPRAVAWQPYQVWSSCDGSLAVTKGAWQRPDGSVGYFTTVWQRQRDDSYKWVMDQGDSLSAPLAAPDMIGATVAECGRPIPPTVTRAPLPTDRTGKANDGTLIWTVLVAPDGARDVKVDYWDGTAWQTAIAAHVAAE